MVEWVNAWASIPTVARSVPCFNPEAQFRMIRALQDGKIHARTREGRLIDREEWATKDQDSLPGISWRDGLEIRRDDLFRWIEQSSPATPAGGAKRGRKPKYDWGAFGVALTRIVHDEGLPSKQAELDERMRHWFIDQIGNHPSDTELKKHISAVYKEFGR